MYQDVEGYMLTVSSSSCYYDFFPLSTMHFCWGRQGIEEWGRLPPWEELVPLSRAKVQIPIYPWELPNSALLFGIALCLLSQGIWSTGQSTFLGERDSFCSMIPCHSCKNQHNFKRGKLLAHELCKNVFFTKNEGDEVKTHPHSNLFLTMIS